MIKRRNSLRGAGNQGMIFRMAEPVFFQHFQVERNPDGGLRELGRGAMGITYKAFDTNLHCPVALKIINSALTDDPKARERFLREARAAARLRHPNVATVMHLGQDGNGCFYAMEFIEGETLEAFVARKGPLPPALALEITAQIARALGAAQNEGLVHRDIKPANIMLARHQGEAEEEGVHVKVIDFGLAKFVEKGKRHLGSGAMNLTMDGAFVGSPYFASPEQIEEGEIDTRSDIYSLGVTLWHMLTGEAPFTGSLGQIMAQHLQRPPPMEKLVARGVPETVRALIGQMLAKAPEDRPADPAALRGRLTECKRALEATPPTPAVPELIAGRYALISDVGEDETGRLFKAEDRQAGARLVAVRRLFPDVLANPQAAAEVGRAVSLTQLVPDPGLTRLYALERLPGGDFLVSEWLEGFDLAALLRTRGELDAPEAFALLQKAAHTVDAAAERGLNQLDLRLQSVRAHFPGGLPKDVDATREPLKNWPPFELKISALELRPDAQQTRSPNDRTFLPQRQQEAAPGRRPVEGAAGMVWSLAEMVYELLGGALPPPGVPRYPPLAKLSEESNAVLRQALLAGAGPAFADARQFARELTAAGADAGAASGSRAGQAPASSTPGRSVAPPPLPPAPGQSAATPPPIQLPQGAASSIHGGTSTFPPPLQPVPAPVKGPNRWMLAVIGLVVLAVLCAALAATVLWAKRHVDSTHRVRKAQSAGDAALEKIAPPGVPVGVRRALPVEPTPDPEPPSDAEISPPPADDEEMASAPQHPSPSSVGPTHLSYQQVPMAVYRARLSEQDHFSSAGMPLTSIADILRQDRANVYRFNRADPEDETDPFFAQGQNRDFFESLNFQERSRIARQRGARSPGDSEPLTFKGGTRETFIRGTPLVEVAIFRGNRVMVTFIAP